MCIDYNTGWVFGDDRSLLWGGEVVVMTASYVHTKQKLSQILLLCGMDQKNGVTSITKDKERWCWRIHNQHVYCVMLLRNVYGRYTTTQSWETRAISGEITLIWQSTTETEGRGKSLTATIYDIIRDSEEGTTNNVCWTIYASCLSWAHTNC